MDRTKRYILLIELKLQGETIRQRSYYAGEICKRSFISTVWPTVPLIRHENGAFQKRSSNLKTPAFRFRVDGKHFENGASRKR